jgi:hypothetical protein
MKEMVRVVKGMNDRLDSGEKVSCDFDAVFHPVAGAG